MPTPRLLHSTQITILRIDTDSTVYDHNAREPVGRSGRHIAITLPGQVAWKKAQVVIEDTGEVEKVDGYILFRRIDLDAKKITLSTEDKITQMGTGDAAIQVNLYIRGIDYRGHYPDQGGYTLIKAWFADKKPARHT